MNYTQKLENVNAGLQPVEKSRLLEVRHADMCKPAHTAGEISEPIESVILESSEVHLGKDTPYILTEGILNSFQEVKNCSEVLDSKGFRRCHSTPDGQTAFYVYGGGVPATVVERLNACLDESERSGTPVFVNFGGYKWTLKRAASGNYNYRWYLEGGGIAIAISASPGVTKGAEFPLCKVVLGWYTASTVDPRLIAKRVFSSLRMEGATPTRYQITRLDLQVTSPEIRLQNVANAMKQGRVVTHANGDCKRYGFPIVQTYFWGSPGSAWKLRIYDKSLEMCVNHDQRKTDFYSKYFRAEERCIAYNEFWSLGRVEFQLSRDFLKPLGINTFEDLFERGGSLIDKLTHDCIRFISKRVKSNHYEDCPDASFWSSIRQMFKMCLSGSKSLGTPEAPKSPFLDEESKQRALSIVTTYLGKLAANMAYERSVAVRTASESIFRSIFSEVVSKGQQVFETMEVVEYPVEAET